MLWTSFESIIFYLIRLKKKKRLKEKIKLKNILKKKKFINPLLNLKVNPMNVRIKLIKLFELKGGKRLQGKR